MENVEKTQLISSEKLQLPTSSDVVLPDVPTDLRYADVARGDTQSLSTDVVPSNSESKMEGIFDETVSTQQIQAAVESVEKVQTSIGKLGESQASTTSTQREAGNSMEDEKPLTLVDKIFVLAENLGEKVASRPVGQTLFRQGDHVLCILEECVAWSVQPADSDQAVQRPLPWVTFLPMMATLKVAGIGAKLVAPLFGRKSVPSEEVVDLIRSRRHKIHAIRYKGICNMKEKAKDSSQDSSLIEKLLLWWPVTVVTKVANLVGLGSEDPELSKTSPVKRNYQQMVQEHMLLDKISPPAALEETSEEENGEEEEVEEEENAGAMFADDLIKKINEINFEEEDSENDPDYEPEESADTSVTSSEDLTDEEEPLSDTEMETNIEVEEERKLKVPRIEIEDSDGSTITPEDSKTEDKTEDKPEDKPGDHAEKELFVSATSSGYQSPEHPSSRATSPEPLPNVELRVDTPRPLNEPTVEKKPSKLSSLFSRKKT